MALLGMDVGSTKCKCVAFSEDGRMLAEGSAAYARAVSETDLDAEELFARARESLAQCAARLTQMGEKADAVCVSSFGESFVALGADGRAVAPVMLYTDGRGADALASLLRDVPETEIMDATLVKPALMYSLPKLAYVTAHNKVARVMLIADYVCWRLCGVSATDVSLACRTLAYEPLTGKWSEKLLARANLAPDAMPEVVPTGTKLGKIRPEIAAELGISPDAQVVIGGHDQIAVAVGSGTLRAGEAALGCGTVECVTPLFEGARRDEGFLREGYVSVPHPTSGLFATYAFCLNGGSLLQWFRERVAQNIPFETLEAGMPAGIDDTIFLPCLSGTATPGFNAAARGSISGLTPESDLFSLYKAALEGVSFEMRYNLERLSRYGVTVESLRATGGGSRSRAYMRIKADALGLPISTLAQPEAGCAGGAMLAGRAVGRFADLSEAAGLFAQTSETFEPGADSARYAEKFARYREARDRI